MTPSLKAGGLLPARRVVVVLLSPLPTILIEPAPAMPSLRPTRRDGNSLLQRPGPTMAYGGLDEVGVSDGGPWVSSTVSLR